MEGRVGRNGEDTISSLPEPLLCHILSFLTTKDSVRTSVLSSTWRNLWLCVSRLDLDRSDFSEDNAFVTFVDKFLRGESYLRGFKLITEHDVSDDSSYAASLMRVVKCKKIQHFEIENYNTLCIGLLTPSIFSMCDTLVSLKLTSVGLTDFESCSLPCLKIMRLEEVIFPSDAAAEKLISCSPVLEDLYISLSYYDVSVLLHVCSPSLKRFTLKRATAVFDRNGAHSVVTDTPRVEYLSLIDYQFKCFKIISMSDSVKVNIDVRFEQMGDDLWRRIIIYNLLNNFSGVGDMTISWKTLMCSYRYIAEDTYLMKVDLITLVHCHDAYKNEEYNYRLKAITMCGST